jgi:putative endonuclease
MEMGGSVYIMTNVHNTVLYIGVSSGLYSRVNDHKTKRYPNSFTAKYNCIKLVWHQSFPSITEAIDREKQMKLWPRKWKIDLINKTNPKWLDLFDEDL